jgi:hypothetical protein
MNMRYLTLVAAVITAGCGIALISKNDLTMGVILLGTAATVFFGSRTMAG